MFQFLKQVNYPNVYVKANHTILKLYIKLIAAPHSITQNNICLKYLHGRAVY